ncbi:MAG: hypothetical protein ACE5NW_03315 [Acidiferrobacterales bacterium]
MGLPTIYQFFRHQVQYGFDRQGLAEPATVDYLSDMLARFAHTRALYAIRDQDGKPLERIAELVAVLHGTSQFEPRAWDRHRRAFIARHIGEYTLFMSGWFRERLRARGELDYYLLNGRSAFWQCAHYEPNPRHQRVFRGLHRNFDHIADTLDNMVRFQLPFTPANVNAQTLIASLWRVY